MAQLTEDGGSPITSYGLEVDFGSGFVAAAGDPIEQVLLTIVVTTGVESGKTYPVRYRTKNIYGWSDYSPELEVIASSVPSEPLNVKINNIEL